MFFPSCFKQGSIFLIFTCKKRQKRIDRNQTNFPPARELATHTVLCNLNRTRLSKQWLS
jgi:REP element-mobilizing transposase RayT